MKTCLLRAVWPLVLAMGVLGMGFVSSTSATPMYTASAELTLGLTGVTDASGASVTDGWSVLAEGFISSALSRTSTYGDASATIVPTVIPGPVSMGIGDSVFQSSEAFGEAPDGRAISILITDLGIWIDNLSDRALTFTFEFDALADAAVSGSVMDGDDASADAQVTLIDEEFGSVDVSLLAYAELVYGIPSETLMASGSFSLTLPSGGSSLLAAFIDAMGDATTGEGVPVPEPAILALMVIGLSVMGFSRKAMRA